MTDTIDPVWIAVIVSAVIGSSTLGTALYHGHIQKKTNSANIALKFIQRFEQPDFRVTSDVLSGLPAPDGWDADAEIQKMMNCFEDMGKFEKDGSLRKDHIIEMHRDTLVLLRDNTRSKHIFEKHRKEDGFYYVHLNRLFGYVNAS